LLALFEPWTPTQCTDLVPNHPLFMFQRGQINTDINVIGGYVKDEGLMFIYEALGSSVSKVEYDAIIPALMGLTVGIKIAEHYPVGSASDARPTLSQVATDGLFHCAGRSASTSTGSNVWMYELEHPMSFYGGGSFGGTQPWCKGYTCHAGELPFVFFPDNLPEVLDDHANYTSDEVILGDAMNRYWGSFAHFGQPGTGSPLRPLEWLKFSNNTRQLLHFATPVTQHVGDAWAEKCAFWDKLGYAWLDDFGATILV